MLKELFRTDQPKTMRERMKPGTIENFQKAFRDIDPSVAETILTSSETRVRIDTLLDAVAALAEHVNRLEARVAKEEEKYRFFAEMLQDMPHPGYFPPLGEGGPFTYAVLFLASLAAGGLAFFFAIGFQLG